MKKYLICILYSVLCTPIFANVVEGVAAIPDNYYDGVSGKKGADNILNALQTCISKDYNEISYKALESHYLNTDFYADTLWDMYSTCRFVYDDANVPQSKVCDGWNKEHVCCQSWLGSGPMVSDMFNVYPTDARVNNLRSNYPYGVVGSNKGISGDPDHHALGKLGTPVNGSGTVYEPDDRYKGDFARTFFYMCARYRNNIINAGNGSTMFTSNPTNLTSYSLNFLLDWHRNDPVSQKEIDRNQGVYGEQNNRNPFIDYPDLVEYIWGDKVGQTVDLASMTPTCEGGGSATPKNKYGVSWSINGVILLVDSVLENKRLQNLPDTPESCSPTSSNFVGWTTAPIAGVLDVAPETLYTDVASIPAIVADITLYAVFAKAEIIDNGVVEKTETINMKAKGYSNGAEVTTVTQNDVTVTFAKGTASTNVPKYYNTGDAVRCYPGNTFTVAAESISKILLTFGSGDGTNPITVNTGTLNGSTWTGSANSVVFTIGDGKHRRIAQLDVTRKASGVQTVYSQYLTSCSTATATNYQLPITNQKMIIDGRLFIIVDGRRYDAFGNRVE